MAQGNDPAFPREPLELLVQSLCTVESQSYLLIQLLSKLPML